MNIEGLHYRIVWGSCMERSGGTGWDGTQMLGRVHSDFQFTFREGRNDMEAIYILGEIIEVGVKEEREYRLAFLDIRKAHDRVVREVLWDQMREAGSGSKMLRLIQRLYSENEESFRLGGIKGRRLGRSKGLRQGCILSSFLFAIYIKKAVENDEEWIRDRDGRSDSSGTNIHRPYCNVCVCVVRDWVVVVVRD